MLFSIVNPNLALIASRMRKWSRENASPVGAYRVRAPTLPEVPSSGTDKADRIVLNGGTAGGVVSIPGFTHQTGRWECYALCVDVDTPGKCFSFLNGASGAGGSAVGAASASNYDGTPFIGLIAGDTTTALNNGSRLGGVLMWESRRPRVDEFMNFYQATRGRYRV